VRSWCRSVVDPALRYVKPSASTRRGRFCVPSSVKVEDTGLRASCRMLRCPAEAGPRAAAAGGGAIGTGGGGGGGGALSTGAGAVEEIGSMRIGVKAALDMDALERSVRACSRLLGPG
jgi:hypothetical protein